MIIYLLKRVVALAFLAYTLMIIARLLGSWFPNVASHPVMRGLAALTDPYLNIFRKFIPSFGMIDLSPMVALFSLQGLEWLILSIL